PPTLMPVEVEKMGVRVVHSLDAAIEGADVIMMLRIQLERQGKLSFPSLREYYNTFGLTPERLRRAKEGVIVMHPGPMNRGVEIASDVADGPWSGICWGERLPRSRRRGMLNVECLMLNEGFRTHSTFNIQHSTFLVSPL